MKTFQDKKTANEKSDMSARTGKNTEACGCDPVVGFDGESQPQKADANVHMGGKFQIKRHPLVTLKRTLNARIRKRKLARIGRVPWFDGHPSKICLSGGCFRPSGRPSETDKPLVFQ
jgi:hypothetical protein